MRLSDAIAMGRMLLKPRAYTTILGDEGCALGMAMAAHGCRSHQEAIAKANSLTKDRKSTRLNSSHSQISYAVFCLKKKTPSAIRIFGPMTSTFPADTSSFVA